MQKKAEEKLYKLFDWAKAKKKKYDALVPISGGKDSSYALHLCKQVYGLNVLAFTNDNGFRTDFVNENVKKMVKKLGVDHVDCFEPIIVELAKQMFLKTGHFCSPCELGMYNSVYMIAEKYDTPLIVYGSSSKTDAGFPKELNPWNPWYFKKVLRKNEILKRMKSTYFGKNYLIRSAFDRLIGKRKLILLPNYIDWNEKSNMESLQREYDLEFHGEHSDCMYTNLIGYLQRRKNDSVDKKTMKYSLLIRNNQLDRETALKLISSVNERPEDEYKRFLEKFSLSPDEFEKASNLSPAPYLKGIPYILNRVRRILRKQY
jgi:tRNA(Ile)-lysidine synthase TilS/MesJ